MTDVGFPRGAPPAVARGVREAAAPRSRGDERPPDSPHDLLASAAALAVGLAAIAAATLAAL